MGKKLSLLFAAAMFALAIQNVNAADSQTTDEALEQQIEDGLSSFARSGNNAGRYHDDYDDDDDNDRDRRFGRNRGMGGRRGHGPAMRQGMGMSRGMGMGMGMRYMRMMNALDLSPEQKQRIVDVMTDHFRERMLTQIELNDAYDRLQELNESENPSHEEIIAANERAGAAHGKLDVLGRKIKDSLGGILTPDQQKQLDELRQNRRRFRHDRDDDDDSDRRPNRMRTGPGPRRMK